MSGPGTGEYEGLGFEPRRPGEPSVGPDQGEASTGVLVSRLSQEMTTLLRGELELARLELSQKAKRAGAGVGAIGAAGVVALYGVGVLIAAVVLALALAIDAWLAALIVAVVLLAAAAGMALFGKKRVDQATPLSPERTADNVKRDVDALKHHEQTRRADTRSTDTRNVGGSGEGSNR